MKYFYFVAAFIFVSVSCVFAGEEVSKSPVVASSQAVKTGQVLSQGKEIVVDSNEALSDDKDYGVGEVREMPESDTYDQNTGMPNVVGSDTAGEIE